MKKMMIIAALAVSMTMNLFALEKGEISKRFKDVESIYNEMQSKFESAKTKKTQEGWLEMEQYRARWRAARDYFDYPIRHIRAKVKGEIKDGHGNVVKPTQDELDEWKKWEGYMDTKIPKMEEFVENAPILLRPSKSSK